VILFPLDRLGQLLGQRRATKRLDLLQAAPDRGLKHLPARQALLLDHIVAPTWPIASETGADLADPCTEKSPPGAAIPGSEPEGAGLVCVGSIASSGQVGRSAGLPLALSRSSLLVLRQKGVHFCEPGAELAQVVLRNGSLEQGLRQGASQANNINLARVVALL